MAQLHNHVSWWWELISSNNYNKLTMLVVTILVLILAILWHKFKSSYSSNGATLPPGPISLPIVGYIPFLSPNLHTQFTDIGKTYGPIYKLYLGSKLHVVINSVELAKVVVRDQDEFLSDRDQTIAALALSHGGQDVLFANNNSNWRKLRKIFLHEILRNKNLETSGSFRRDEVRKTIKNIFSKIGSEVNVREIALSTETNVLTQMVFKNTYDRGGEYSNLIAEINTEVSNIVEILGRVNFADFFPSLARFDLQGIERDMKKQVKKLDQILTHITEDRIEYNSKKQLQGEKDFLQTLLDHKDQKDGTSLNTIQINQLLLDVMIAGTETSATLIEWTMATILKHRKVMKRVQEELAEVVGQNNIVEESHIPKLRYLNATIKETLRLYPVGPFIIPRASSKECRVGGFTIPKGCIIFLNAWSIHRDPQYWDNHLEFDPERFLEGKWDYNGTNLKFFPFGSGRRLCPGVSLAEKMVMFILASLLHSFDWSLPKGEEHDFNGKFGFTLKKTKTLVALPSQRLPDVHLYM